MPNETAYIIFIILVALTFDFLNGFHDAANSIATVVSTRVLTPQVAVSPGSTAVICSVAAAASACALAGAVQGATATISYKGGNGTPTRPVNVIRIQDNKRVLVSSKAPDPAIIPAPRLDLNAAQ